MEYYLKILRSTFKHRSGFIGLVFIFILLVLAFLSDWIIPVDPYLQNYQDKFIPPIWSEGGRWPFILGTDVLGRDLFSRLLIGSKLSLFIGFTAVVIGAVIGIPIGLVSGFYGGKVDSFIMRGIDILLAFPSLLLAVCIVAILSPSLTNAVIAIGIVSIPTFARVVRSRAITEREKEYVMSDIAIGKKNVHILFSTVLRNIWGPIIVLLTLGFGGAILDAAGLSFLGLGAQPPTPEWGALIAEGKKYVFQGSWLILFPGLAIFFTVISFNLLGDALRDILDPKSR